MIVTSPLEQLWGVGGVDAAFEGHPRVVVPWPSAPRRRGLRRVDTAVTARLLAGPPRLVDVDPRTLLATQPWVLRHHVEYYLSGGWERTGVTSADRDADHNRYPLVADIDGRAVLLGGHHRAMAALLSGRPLRARVERSGRCDPVPVLPLLLVDTGAAITASGLPQYVRNAYHCDTSEFACRLIERGRTAVVPVPGVAFGAMVQLGLSAATALSRLRWAGLIPPLNGDQRSP